RADGLTPGQRRVNETAVPHKRVVENELGAEGGQVETHHRQIPRRADMDHRNRCRRASLPYVRDECAVVGIRNERIGERYEDASAKLSLRDGFLTCPGRNVVVDTKEIADVVALFFERMDAADVVNRVVLAVVVADGVAIVPASLRERVL